MYAAEMGISIFSDIDRYTLEDAIVTLSYHLQVAGGSYEEVPMGIFEVSEANRKAKCLEIKAYGYMVQFEKAFNGFEASIMIGSIRMCMTDWISCMIVYQSWRT